MADGWVPAPPVSSAASQVMTAAQPPPDRLPVSLRDFLLVPPHHSTHMGGFKRLRVRYSYALLMIGPYYLLPALSLHVDLDW